MLIAAFLGLINTYLVIWQEYAVIAFLILLVLCIILIYLIHRERASYDKFAVTTTTNLGGWLTEIADISTELLRREGITRK